MFRWVGFGFLSHQVSNGLQAQKHLHIMTAEILSRYMVKGEITDDMLPLNALQLSTGPLDPLFVDLAPKLDNN